MSGTVNGEGEYFDFVDVVIVVVYKNLRRKRDCDHDARETDSVKMTYGLPRDLACRDPSRFREHG